MKRDVEKSGKKQSSDIFTGTDECIKRMYTTGTGEYR